MADDFFNLAQLEAPRMMPETPMGGGALAGYMYGQDKARQNTAFTKANSLAEMRALLESQKANETMAGAPGRQADIQYNNSMSQGKLGTLPDALSAQSTTASNTNRQAELAKLSPYASSYDSSWTNQEKRDFIDSMEADGVKTIGKRSISDMKDNLDHVDSMFDHVKKALVNTPQHEQTMDLQGKRNEGWLDREDIKADAKITVADLQGKYAGERAQARVTAQKAVEDMKSGKLNMAQYEAKMRQRAEHGDTYAMQVVNELTAHKDYRAFLLGSQAKPQINPAALNPGAGPNTPLLNTPPVPPIPTMPVPPAAQGAPAPQPAPQPQPQPQGGTNGPPTEGVHMMGGKIFSGGKDVGDYYKNKDGDYSFQDPVTKEWVIVKKP